MPAKKKRKRPRRDRPCPLCRQGIEYVDYKDTAQLKQFLNERGKIKARRTTGSCSPHQVMIAAAIKNAREMALIPYAVR